MSYQVDIQKRLVVDEGDLVTLETAPFHMLPVPRTKWDTEVFTHYAKLEVGEGMIFNCMIGKIKSNLERTFASHGLTKSLDYTLRSTVIGADGLRLPGTTRAYYVKRLTLRDPVLLT